jgi:hypothetical protein
MFSNCSANAEDWQHFLQAMLLSTTLFSRPVHCSVELALTFKIEKISGADRLIIRLIGELNADCLSELEAQIGSDGRSIELDMDEVTLVDVDVIRFLINCEARGIQLRGCSRYIREWIRREQESE